MTFRRQSLLVALALVPGLLLAGCGTSDASLSSILITPSPVRVAVGGTSQLTVTGTYSDGTRAPLTSGVTFASSAASVAAVSTSGVVTAIGSGTSTVTATISGLTATTTVTVSSGPATLEAIAVLPPEVPLRIGGTSQLTVTGTYSDGSTFNLTSGSTFSSTSSGVATVSAGGLVTATGNGTATITATHTASGLIATAAVTVSASAPTLKSIAVVPATVPLLIGATGQLTVTGTYSDDTTVNLTAGSTFVSSNLGAATVSDTGLVTAVAGGSAIVTATHTASGKIASATVNVSATLPTLDSIAVTPATATLAVAATRQLTVTGTYSDSTTADLTSASTFASSATGVATVSAGGLVTAVANGTATITATNTASGLTATSAITVSNSAPTLTSITVAPSAPSIAIGATQQLTVTGHYSDSSTATLTTGLTYASSATGVATVSASGLVAGVTAGSATITVTNTTPNLTATSAVTVTAASAGGAVFLGSYPAGVNALAGFDGSDTATNPVVIDPTVTNNGNASLKITGTGCGSYIGGYIASAAPTDLHTFNALSFWAKTDVPNTTINNFGFGNDNTTATNSFNVESHGPAAPFTGYALTTTFTKFYIPIPTPAALTAANGLFYFSGPCLAAGANVWVNDIQFETLTPAQLASNFGSVVNASTGAPPTLNVAVGTPALIGNIGPNTVNYTSAAAYQVGWAHFTYASSNDAVATVDANGMVVGHAAGSADITVAFGGTTLNTIAVTVTVPMAVPTTLAPAPTHPAANVVSLYTSSGTYTDIAVATWATGWGVPSAVTDFSIGGPTVKKYVGVSFVGVDFAGFDATTFTHFHVDVWTPDATQFGVKLVNDAGGAASEATVSFNATTTPAITTGSWISLDIPLSSFTGMAFNNVNQLLWLDNVGGPEFGTFYIDNVYFWK